MSTPFIALDLKACHPEAATLMHNYVLLKESIAEVRSKFQQASVKCARDNEIFVDMLDKAFVDCEPATTALLHYWGVDSIGRLFLLDLLLKDRMPEYPLQIACDELLSKEPSAASSVSHANIVGALLMTRDHISPLQLGCEVDPSRMYRLLGYALASAVQKRLRNQGTAYTVRRARLETVADIVSHYIDEHSISIDETNWRELMMVYLANAID